MNKNNIKLGEKADTTFYYNDIVMQCANNYDAEIFEKYKSDMTFFERDEDPISTFIANGESGRMEDIHVNGKECKISFDEDVRYDKDMLTNLKLAYSISVHKSQGGQAKIVILLTPSTHTIMLNSNLIYVGITRAQTRCFQIGEVDTALRAIKKKENFNRITNMSYLINNKELSKKEYDLFVIKYQASDNVPKYEEDDDNLPW